MSGRADTDDDGLPVGDSPAAALQSMVRALQDDAQRMEQRTAVLIAEAGRREETAELFERAAQLLRADHTNRRRCEETPTEEPITAGYLALRAAHHRWQAEKQWYAVDEVEMQMGSVLASAAQFARASDLVEQGDLAVEDPAVPGPESQHQPLLWPGTTAASHPSRSARGSTTGAGAGG